MFRNYPKSLGDCNFDVYFYFLPCFYLFCLIPFLLNETNKQKNAQNDYRNDYVPNDKITHEKKKKNK